jgi:hypothetical protein
MARIREKFFNAYFPAALNQIRRLPSSTSKHRMPSRRDFVIRRIDALPNVFRKYAEHGAAVEFEKVKSVSKNFIK